MKKIKIGNRLIGDDEPIFVIAEMAWSHDGSIEKAKKIIKGAADAKADAVSFHITNMEDYMVRDYGSSAGQVVFRGKRKIKMYDYLDKLNLNNNNWKELFFYAKILGLKICAMPNDSKSLKLCEKLNPDIYVISAASFVEDKLISDVAKQKKPVILRIGGATFKEIKRTINLIRKQKARDIILLHGIQSYPTKIENTNLRSIPYLRKTFKLPVGLADHINAESEITYFLPLLSIPLGAVVIEKHLTHNRSLKGLDYISALNPDEFKKFVMYIRETEKSLTINYLKGLSRADLEYRKIVRMASNLVFRRLPELFFYGSPPNRFGLAGLGEAEPLGTSTREKLVVRKAGEFPLGKSQPGRKSDF